jgi:hypothetical protein
MSYVTNPTEQVRWFLGKNMTSETIPPRACCAVPHMDYVAYPNNDIIHTHPTGKVKDSDLPYFHLWKPGVRHEVEQDPAKCVFNGPEAIQAGKIGRVTMDYPVAAICGVVPGSGYTGDLNLREPDQFGPCDGYWYLALGRCAFRSSGQSLDGGPVTALTPRHINNLPVQTLLISPNCLRESLVRYASGLEPTSDADDVPLRFLGDTTPMLSYGYAFGWGRATSNRPSGEQSGIVINQPGYYKGVASASIGIPSSPTGGAAGFVWCITDGILENPTAPDTIAYTDFIGYRAISVSGCYGLTIASTENVCVPFSARLAKGNIVHLRTIGDGVVYSCGVLVFRQVSA